MNDNDSTEQPTSLPAVRCSDLFGVSQVRNVCLAVDRMVLAHLDDEGYKSAEFQSRVITLPLGYRIVRPQNRVSKLKAFGGQVEPEFHGGLVKRGPAGQATLNQRISQVILALKQFIIRCHRFLNYPNDKAERRSPGR
jgi:hypothetical protein